MPVMRFSNHRPLSSFAIALTILLVAAAPAPAADYEATVLDREPPKDELSAEIAESLQSEGIAVKFGETRTICEIWLRKAWPIQADFQPTAALLYPFREGELIGVIRYPRRASDFRDQQIASGVYTLRFGLQPVDGNHVGTSPTRDFLILLPAEDDTSLARLDPEKMVELSTEVSLTSHPALLPLQEPQKDVTDELPAMRHQEHADWWIVQFAGQGEADGTTTEMRVDLIVVGVALE